MYISKLYKLYNLWYRITRKIKGIFVKKKTQIYLRDRVSEYHSIWHIIADKLNAKITTIDKDIWLISKNDRVVPLRLHQLPLDNDVVLRICGKKELVHRLLSNANIPIPKYCLFDVHNFTLAKEFLNEHPKGVVVKPTDGYSGLGVTTHIYTVKQLQSAMILASLYSKSLMIEEQIVGENYRILVFKGKVLHAVKRKGVTVKGDGKSSISVLINNSVMDPDIKFTLDKQGLTLKSIPNKDEMVLVRSLGAKYDGRKELRTIYNTEVTDLLHASIVSLSCKAAKIVCAELVGVDIITTDISKPIENTNGIINELNTTPALHHHYDYSKEELPLPALTIVKNLLGES